MAYQTTSPILLLSFNRIDTITQVLERIRTVKPQYLYIYADAPRTKEEKASCDLVRSLEKEVNWPCEIRTMYPEKNLGPRIGVSSAITWFFENVEYGIILEHDCLPSADFFCFCDYLLDYYRFDTRIMHISGMAPYKISDLSSDYYFLRIPLIWGWASWRRAWSAYDLQLESLKSFIEDNYIRACVNDVRSQANWLHYFRASAAGTLATWDYQWTYAVMRSHGLCVTPIANMVSNIGFGEHSLHSRDTKSRFAALPFASLNQPLRHPDFTLPLVAIEDRLNQDVFRFRTIKYLIKIMRVGDFISGSPLAINSIKRINSVLQRIKNFSITRNGEGD